MTLLTKGLILKFPINRHVQSDHPSRKNVGLSAEICSKYCTKRVGQDSPGPARRADSASPGLLTGLREGMGRRRAGKADGRKGGERKGREEGREGKGRYPPPFRFSGYARGCSVPFFSLLILPLRIPPFAPCLRKATL